MFFSEHSVERWNLLLGEIFRRV